MKNILSVMLFFLSIFALAFVPSEERVGCGDGQCLDAKSLFSHKKRTKLRDYFKEAKNKRDDSEHSISQIDQIYVIARKKSKDFEDLKERLLEYKVDPYRFTCVNPDSISYKCIKHCCVKGDKKYGDFKGWTFVSRGRIPRIIQESMTKSRRSYFHESLTVDRVAAALDHLSIIKDAIKSKYKTIWIMEEDVSVNVDPNCLSTYIASLNDSCPEWGVLYTDFGTRNKDGTVVERTKIFERPDVAFLSLEEYKERGLGYFRDGDPRYQEQASAMCGKVGLVVGAHSYVLNNKAMHTIMDYYEKHNLFVPYEMEIQMIPGIEPYCTPISLVSSTRRP